MPYKSLAEVKLGGFQTQLEMSCLSNHTKELSHNKKKNTSKFQITLPHINTHKNIHKTHTHSHREEK